MDFHGEQQMFFPIDPRESVGHQNDHEKFANLGKEREGWSGCAVARSVKKEQQSAGEE